ncbi:MAG: glycosyltransferase [Verrucomicrobiales bacterium]
MARITIHSEGTLGDHFPFLALGEALVGRGHTVRYAAPAYLRDEVEEGEMQWFPCRPDLDPTRVLASPEAFDHWSAERGGPDRSQGPKLRDYFEEYGLSQKLSDLTDATKEVDLLISSKFSMTAGLVSELLNVPCVRVALMPWFDPSPGTPAAQGMELRDQLLQSDPSMQLLVQKMNAVRVRCRLQRLRGPLDVFDASRLLLATSPLFGKPEKKVGCELVQTGFWLHVPRRWRAAGLSTDTKAWLTRQKRPPLVLSFSSQPVPRSDQVLDCHLQAAERLGRGLVVQGGWSDWNSRAFESACQNGKGLRLSAGPQEELFQRAGAVIHHGGIGTTVRALSAETPQLVEPWGNDQFYNARQVIALGIGAAINPHKLNVAGLERVLLNSVLTREVAQTTKRRARQMAKDRGIPTAVDTIESWLQTPC